MTEWPTRAEALAEAHSDVVNDTERPCVHEWRLIDEKIAQTRYVTETSYLVEDVRRWYCVRCRTIEETRA